MSVYDTEPDSRDPGRLRHPEPTHFCCMDCDWRGDGYMARATHVYRTSHHVIWAGDTRALTRRRVKETA